MTIYSKEETLARLKSRQHISASKGEFEAAPVKGKMEIESAIKAKGLRTFSFFSGTIIFLLTGFIVQFILALIFAAFFTAGAKFGGLIASVLVPGLGFILIIGLSISAGIVGSRRLQPHFRKHTVRNRWIINVTLILVVILMLSQMISIN